MKNKSEKQMTKPQKRDDTASVVASIFGKTDRLVRMVIQGQVENPAILEAAITYKEGKTKLIQEIERLIPIS
jgi:hypothetical protein